MRLLNKVDPRVMFQAEVTSEYESAFANNITEQYYCEQISNHPSVGFEIGGKCVGGIVISKDRLHLSVLPEYHGKWGHLFMPAFKWAFSLRDPLYAYVSRENEKVLRFIRRHDWKQVNEIDSTVIFELTDLTTRYPK